jgi:hypothetical protein
LDHPQVRSKLAGLGVDAMMMTPKEFDSYVEKGVATDAALVKAIGLKAD